MLGIHFLDKLGMLDALLQQQLVDHNLMPALSSPRPN
jgi:hypothetical protein